MSRFKCLFSIALIVCSGFGYVSAQSDATDVPKRQRRISPIESEIFLGDWWDYYNRAIRRFDAGDLQGAEADLKEALKFNDDENPRARTYGVHFQEYFPHAELGAILYESGRYWEAVPELMRSLKIVPLEQSRFYLHEARRQIAIRSPIDKRLPSIRITDPPTGLVTNKTRIRIKGIAEDDLFIDKIIVGDQPIHVDKANSKVTFETEIRLPHETNHIPVTVYDLIGQHQTEIYTVIVDSQGPVFLFDTIQLLQGDTFAHLVGKVYDRNVISEIYVEGLKIQTHGVESEAVDVTVPIAPGQKEISLVLKDGFGNITEAQPPLRQRVGAVSPSKGLIRTASVNTSPELMMASTQSGPSIEIKAPLNGQKVYDDEVLIEMEVTDSIGVQSIDVAGKPVDLPEEKDKRCIVSIAVELIKDGTHTLNIHAVNKNGNEGNQYITLNYTDLKDLKNMVCQQASCPTNMGIMLNDFTGVNNDEAKVLADKIFHALLFNEDLQSRFSVYTQASLSAAIRDQRLDESPLVDKRYKQADGKIVDIVLQVDAEIISRNSTFEVSLIVTELSGGKNNDTFQCYRRNDDDNAIEDTAHSLTVALLQSYPKLEGTIIGARHLPVTSLSEIDGVKRGMEVVTYKKDEKGYLYPYRTMVLREVTKKDSLISTSMKDVSDDIPNLEIGDRLVTR